MSPRASAETASVAAGSVPSLSNAELARIFYEIADLLEIKGEVVYKAVAYRRVADAIERSPVEVARAYREGHPPRLAGVGDAIALKLRELADTGRLAYLERLRGEVPRSLLELLAVPGVGPRTVYTLHELLGVTNLDDLRRAAESGALRSVRGMTERTEQGILAGIAGLERAPTRMRLGQAARLGRRSRRRSPLRRASSTSSRRDRSADASRRSATSTCWRPPPARPPWPTDS